MAAIILDDPYAYVMRHHLSNWDTTSTSGMIITISPTSVASNYPSRIVASNWEVLFAPYGREAILPIRSAEDFIRRQKARGRHPMNLQVSPSNDVVVPKVMKAVKYTPRQPRRTEAGQKRRMYVQKIRSQT